MALITWTQKEGDMQVPSWSCIFIMVVLDTRHFACTIYMRALVLHKKVILPWYTTIKLAVPCPRNREAYRLPFQMFSRARTRDGQPGNLHTATALLYIYIYTGSATGQAFFCGPFHPPTNGGAVSGAWFFSSCSLSLSLPMLPSWKSTEQLDHFGGRGGRGREKKGREGI